MITFLFDNTDHNAAIESPNSIEWLQRNYLVGAKKHQLATFWGCC